MPVHLVKKCPRVPTWQHALGHFEWRAGNYSLAERAFTEAIDLYAEWMESNEVTKNDCEGYMKAKCYLANTLYQRGDFTGAMRVAQELRAMKLDPARPRSAGNHIILWRGYSLPARLYMARGDEGDLDLALESLPSKEELIAMSIILISLHLRVSMLRLSAPTLAAAKRSKDNAIADAKTLRNITLRSRIRKMAEVVRWCHEIERLYALLQCGK